jgi:predicted metal-dependent phosphoesterase TrpH
MRTPMIRMALAAAAASAWFLAGQPAPRNAQEKRWYKGNLHTHTTNSDGDTAPETAAAWYKTHGYQFLILSDHNVITQAAPLNDALAEPEKFLLVQGEEVTDRAGGRPIHVNAYGLARLVMPAGGADAVSNLQTNVNNIRAAGALPAVNHPNFGWALQSKQLLAIDNLNLFEVYNGHPAVYNRGGGGAESLEEMWDILLTAGRRINGIAVDDAHHFKKWGKEFSNPGRGWVVVRAAGLKADQIVSALAAGDFYASTGVELNDISVTASEMRIDIKRPQGSKQTTYFIGKAGRVLSSSFDDVAVYRFQPDDRYVRAVVRASNGDDAWVQPVFRER